MPPRDDESDEESGGSPPCFLHELDPKGAVGPDRQQLSDVTRWRKAERERLIGARLQLSADYRAAQTAAMTRELDRLILPAADTRVRRLFTRRSGRAGSSDVDARPVGARGARCLAGCARPRPAAHIPRVVTEGAHGARAVEDPLPR